MLAFSWQLGYALLLFFALLCVADTMSRDTKINHLKHELHKLEEYAKKMEREIDNINTDLSPHQKPHNLHRSKRKHHRNTHSHLTFTAMNTTRDSILSKSKETRSTIDRLQAGSHQNEIKQSINVSDIYWPRFEDLLLASGKKYDWKSDRWIRIPSIQPNQLSQSEGNKEKSGRVHRFNYRRVRLSNGKSKGNVVIAVTAVR